MSDFDSLLHLLQRCSPDQKQLVFQKIRSDIKIHPLEAEFSSPAEVILEAIHRSADLTKRGVRGLIAEASFVVEVLPLVTASGWRDITPIGELPYDALLEKGGREVRIQVKMQRQKEHRPMMAKEGYRDLPADHYTVEIQRTRGGKDSTGADTRPYKFGEFDLLAVSMQASTGNWSDFMYAPAKLLQPDPKKSTDIRKFQAIPQQATGIWTNSLVEALDRLAAM
jgi:hypothetical protein